MKFSSRISIITLCALTLGLSVGAAFADTDYTEYKQLRARYDLGQPFSTVDKARFDALNERFTNRSGESGSNARYAAARRSRRR